jgi:hypothetical protein
MRKKGMNSGFRNGVIFSTEMAIFNFPLKFYSLAIRPLFMETFFFKNKLPLDQLQLDPWISALFTK